MSRREGHEPIGPKQRFQSNTAAQAGKPFFSGTTGLQEQDLEVLKDCAQTIPVLYATNTSLSLAVTRCAVDLIARLLKNQGAAFAARLHFHTKRILEHRPTARGADSRWRR